MKKLLALCAAAALALGIAGCANEDATLTIGEALDTTRVTAEAVGVQSNLDIKIDDEAVTEVELEVGDTAKLTTGVGGVTLESEDETIAQVASDGTITAVAEGETEIIIKYGDFVIATIAVAVVPTDAEIAIIEFDATDKDNASPKAALTATSAAGVFGTVETGFVTASTGIQVDGLTIKDGYPKVESKKFTVTSTSNTKVAGKTDNSSKVTFVGYGYAYTNESSDSDVSMADKAVVAQFAYTFTLAKKAAVTASQVAFNGQNGNLKGKVIIKDSSGTEKASGVGSVKSKEDDDAATDAVELDAGTYTAYFSFQVDNSSGAKVAKKTDDKTSAFDFYLQKFTIKAVAAAE